MPVSIASFSYSKNYKVNILTRKILPLVLFYTKICWNSLLVSRSGSIKKKIMRTWKSKRQWCYISTQTFMFHEQLQESGPSCRCVQINGLPRRCWKKKQNKNPKTLTIWFCFFFHRTKLKFYAFLHRYTQIYEFFWHLHSV